MAPPLLSRLRRRDAEPVPSPPPPPRLPPPGVLRRERRALVRAREERIRDLGGLMLEMYRRDIFREDLIDELCVELIALEARLRELELLLGGLPLPASACACGVPLAPGVRYCPNCGAPAPPPYAAAWAEPVAGERPADA